MMNTFPATLNWRSEVPHLDEERLRLPTEKRIGGTNATRHYDPFSHGGITISYALLWTHNRNCFDTTIQKHTPFVQSVVVSLPQKSSTCYQSRKEQRRVDSGRCVAVNHDNGDQNKKHIRELNVHTVQ